MKYDVLAQEILDWYHNNKNNPSKWSNNPVGKAIKQIMLNSKNWKNAPRGNPAKGFEIMQENKNNPKGLISPQNNKEVNNITSVKIFPVLSINKCKICDFPLFINPKTNKYECSDPDCLG